MVLKHGSHAVDRQAPSLVRSWQYALRCDANLNHHTIHGAPVKLASSQGNSVRAAADSARQHPSLTGSSFPPTRSPVPCLRLVSADPRSRRAFVAEDLLDAGAH